MTTPSNPKSGGDDRNLVPVDETAAVAFEDRLHIFWEKNGKIVVWVCVAILLGILGKGVWEWQQKNRQAEIGQEYAAAKTPEELKAFAAAHAGHELAGIAQLRIADEAYAAGKASEAVAGYEQAAGVLQQGPLAARAQIGRALAKVQLGKTTEAMAELKRLADDSAQLESVRAEAAYHVASVAAASGDVIEAQKYLTRISQSNADPRSNPWAMRAMTLQMNLPRAPVNAPPMPASDGASAPQDDAPAGASITLPSK